LIFEENEKDEDGVLILIYFSFNKI